MAKFNGVSLSDGISYGNIVKVKDNNQHIFFSPTKDKENEKHRVREALNFAEEYQLALIEKYKDDDEIRNILTSYLYMIKDEDLLKKLDETIDSISCKAEYAIQTEFEKVINSMLLGESEYLKSRGDDLYSVMNKILKLLSGNKSADANDLQAGSVVTAEMLSPIFLAGADINKIVGIITSSSSPTSHLAIVARSLKIPMVTCTKEDMNSMADDQIVIIDGTNGMVITNPTAEDMQYYDNLMCDLNAEKEKLERYKELEGKTIDGIRIAVQANIVSKEDVAWACREGAEGIGLVRTEMLFHNMSRIPTMEQQMAVYKEIVENAPGNSVVFRLFDFSSDKDFFNVIGKDGKSGNIGYRGIRVLLENEKVLRDQIRAILLSSEDGEVTILVPFVSTPDEIIRVREIIDEEYEFFMANSIPLNQSVKLASMIETPSAAILSDEIARQVDMLSIGTNDLIQYTLGADRNSSRTLSCFKNYHPAVLRFISMTADAGKRNQIPVCVCGEAASDLRLIRILVGLGITQLSVTPDKVQPVKSEVEKHEFSDDVIFANNIMASSTVMEAEAMLAVSEL